MTLAQPPAVMNRRRALGWSAALASSAFALPRWALDEKQWFERRFFSQGDGAKRLTRMRELAA